MIDENKVSLSRNDIMEYLQGRGISTRPGTHSLHTLDYYKNLYNISADSFPNAKKANDNSMAIPLHNKMEEEDYKYIVNSIKGIN
jgi:dTDP-4-amino-4,6-dideoxygalactose transaminase